jgi:hypothetical protein
MNKKNLQTLLCGFLAALVGGQSAQAGSVSRQYFSGISSPSDTAIIRQSVSTLTGDPSFPYSPDFNEQLDDFRPFVAGQAVIAGLQGKDNTGADYGSWIRGYIEAPATGVYLFSIASRDDSELWLNTNNVTPSASTPADIHLIAYEPGAGSVIFVGSRLESRVSAPISLIRGQKYYFEVLQKVGAGQGYIQVGWQRPDGVQEIIPALNLAQFEINYATSVDLTGQAPQFNGNGVIASPGGYLAGNITNAVALNEGDQLLLPLDIASPQPTTFVWKTNGVVVPGENLSFFRINHTPATYNGVKIQAVISNNFGAITSAVATVTVTPDNSSPAVLTVDTAGNPNLVEVIYSKIVDPASSTNLANYNITNLAGGGLTITNVILSADQTTVFLTGAFNFSTASNYLITIKNVKDQTTVGNLLSPNPSTVAFTLTAPLGTTYNFESGKPADLTLAGNAVIATNGSVQAPSGSSYLDLTKATASRNGAALFPTRRDVDQVHIKFKTRISDAGTLATSGQPWGDGFSLNLASVLPSGTFTSPQFGYSPVSPGNQFTVYFNSHDNGASQPPEIGVSFNNSVLTNILAGTNGVALNGIPSIVSVDGHWAPVDINLHRDGTLNLAFDGVILLTNYPTPWLGIQSAQLNFGAATRQWYETHWIDDLYINYGEGDVGNVSLASSSILGGTFFEGPTVNLIAAPVGAGPFTYQWYKNGVPITGANGRILTFLAVAGAGGTGGNYSLAVSNSFSGAVSANNTVFIQPDLVPPSIVSARALAGGVNQIILQFSKPLDPATATALATYSSSLFSVTGVALSLDGKTAYVNTTQQRVGAAYPVTITGLKDTTLAGNVLNTNLTIISTLKYSDEIYADNPARYFKLDETNGTAVYTQVAISDVLNTNGTYQNFPVLGVPPLLPSASSNEFAVRFVSARTNWALIPNGGDINDFRGPWPKKSWELWFNASSFPPGVQPGDNAVQAQYHAVAGLWEEGGNQRDATLYLWNSNGIANTATGFLTLHSYNSTPDGPGAPFGLLNSPATYVTYPVTTGVTYHVVGVLDGDPSGQTGGLRLYVNGQQVAQLTNGVGQLYNHNGDVQIAQGNARSHLNASGNFFAFDGVLDEIATYNSVLSSNRILSHYLAGQGVTTVPTASPTLVTSVDPRGNPNRVNVQFNQPVSAATATNLANYVVKTSGNTILPATSARLASDLRTVTLNGAFNFALSNNYNLTVSGVADILVPGNTVASTNLTFTFVTGGPVGVSGSTTPASLTVTENQTAQFAVTATGQAPYSYQWLTNGVAWPGNTNASLTFPALWNFGGNYSVVVSNEFSSITSSPASTLAVQTDVAAPQLTGVRGLAGTLNQILLTFNEPLDPASATNLATYSIPTAGATGLALLGAAISTNGQQVTLTTTAQINGQTNQIAINNLKDRAHVPNTLTVTAQFVSGISYRDEVLAESPVRYYTFDETNGTAFGTLVSKFDTDPTALAGTINYDDGVNGVLVGVPGLVPNVPNNRAFNFNTGNTTNGSVDLPNGRDLTAILGPWPRVTHIFSFRADKLPRVFVDPNTGATNSVEAPGIYGHSYVQFYLYGTQTNSTATNALLVFKANNTSTDGPGTPWGGSSVNTAKYISYPIVAGQTYNVVGVVDGNANITGQLRLYINGTLVGTVLGIGQLYKHPNNPPAFGHAFLTTVQGKGYTIEKQVSGTWADPFHGVIDEFAIINGTLSSSRITQLYNFSQTSAINPSFAVVTNSVVPSAPNISLGSVSGGAFNLSWPVGAAGYYLEYTTNLASGVWLSNPVAPSTVNGFNIVTQAISGGGSKFFRLHHP